MPPSEKSRWFAEHVQRHEPALRAYLLRLLACEGGIAIERRGEAEIVRRRAP